MGKRTREKPLDKEVAEFVIWHLHDRGAFAPLTGTDWDAWRAYIHLVRLWGRTRAETVLQALRYVVHSAQVRHADVMAVFKKSIPCLLDWSDERQLWPQIAPNGMFLPCPDGPRICRHERSKPRENFEPGEQWRECRDCHAIWKVDAA